MTLTIAPGLAAYAASENRLPPRHLGRRYDRSGRFLPEPGNTVVCHLMDGSPSHKAVLACREGMKTLPSADRLTFTVPSSLHMTLFQGVIEFRRDWPYWPREMPADAPIEAMTRHFVSRLSGFTAAAPFAMTVTDVKPTGLVLDGLTEGDRKALAEWRDRLADAFGYRHPDHDDYVFHITFAYLIDWLPDSDLPAWQDFRDQALDRFAREAPVIALQPPAFCRFVDMNHFEELIVLT